jgi:virulence factor Mce-like protein
MSWRRQNELSRFSPLVLGAFAILATIVLFYLSATKELPWSGGHELKLQFASANQIAPNAPVRVAGVNVGEVGSIESGPGGTAMVTVELDDEALPIHEDAIARIRPRTFLEGAFFVDIKPGSPSAPEVGDGGTIPVGQTEVPVQLDQILSSLKEPVREQLRYGVQELATGFDGRGPAAINATIPVLDPFFTDGAHVAEALTGTAPHDLSRAIASTSRVTEALAADRPKLGLLVSSFSEVARALADRQRDLQTSIRGVDALLAEAPATLDALSSATPETRGLVADLRPVLRAAPSVVNPAVPLAVQLERLLRPGRVPRLVSLAEPAVGSLARLAPDATTSFAGLRAPARCLLENALPALTSVIPDGALTSDQPAYRELLYSLVGLASSTRNFDGNGFSTRYYAGFSNELQSLPSGNPLEPLYGVGGSPVIGSSPRKPAEAPPARPDVPCTESDAPDLDAAQGPPDILPASASFEYDASPASPKVSKLLNGEGQ